MPFLPEESDHRFSGSNQINYPKIGNDNRWISVCLVYSTWTKEIEVSVGKKQTNRKPQNKTAKKHGTSQLIK